MSSPSMGLGPKALGGLAEVIIDALVMEYRIDRAAV
jgi:hypothetical protein